MFGGKSDEIPLVEVAVDENIVVFFPMRDFLGRVLQPPRDDVGRILGAPFEPRLHVGKTCGEPAREGLVV